MAFLTPDRRKKYSAERLRWLYGDLLRCIDYENHDVLWELRHHEAESSPHFGLGRKVFLFKAKQQHELVDERMEQRRRDVAAAFLTLAATRSIVQEGRKNQPVLMMVVRDQATVEALRTAKALETNVVSLIRSIGEVVVNAQGQQSANDASKQSLRSDEAFEYFCEKAILALFVELACDVPSKGEIQGTFHGVVWSPNVKAQVFHTISLLVQGVRDASALYYLLSQNCVNQVVANMLPLTQWTDPALEIMLPPYVEMVKTLTIQLSDSPHLFPFFIIHDQNRIHFPLFSATLRIGTSAFAESNSFVHATCLNLIVDIMQIPYPPIQDWLHEAELEQLALTDHLSALLLRRYTRLVHLTTGPVVDGIRSSAIGGQLKGLNDQMELLNDIFRCPLAGLQVRLCETLLRQVISVLWKSFQSSQRPFLSSVGVLDSDAIPAEESAAQTSTVFLSRFFAKLKYAPALRMFAVALWHSKACPLWEVNATTEQKTNTESDKYLYTKALHQVVQGDTSELGSNLFRGEFYRALRGDYGEWRIVSAANLMFQCLQSISSETLELLNILPTAHAITPVEESMIAFLTRDHMRISNVSITALECVASLVVEWVYRTIQNAKDPSAYADKLLHNSAILRALKEARDYFFLSTVACENTVGAPDLFVDVIDATVLSLYKRITLSVNGVRSGPRILAYNARKGCSTYGNDAEVLVRKMRGIKSNEVEHTRFYAHMALHFRAVTRILESYLDTVVRSTPDRAKELKPDMLDRADQLSTIFGGLREKPQIGSDIDIRGRMSFPFHVDAALPENSKASEELVEGRERTFSDDMIFRSSSTFVAVLDPTYLFVVKPLSKHGNTRGTVLCCVPLLNVIAAASDADWLHVAVRHDDVSVLIKNGNMAFRFDTPGTGVIVRQYIDRSRQVLRGQLIRKIKDLFTALETKQENGTPEKCGETIPSEDKKEQM